MDSLWALEANGCKISTTTPCLPQGNCWQATHLARPFPIRLMSESRASKPAMLPVQGPLRPGNLVYRLLCLLLSANAQNICCKFRNPGPRQVVEAHQPQNN